MKKTTKMQNYLQEILSDIHMKALNLFVNQDKGFCKPKTSNIEEVRKKLQIILLSYQRTSDSIIYWSLYPKDKIKITLLERMSIRNGEGTVGFILRSKMPELVNNTFEDPRGIIAFEDEILGNKSWFGIPYFVENNIENDIDYIVSFSYDDYDFWNLDKANDLIKDTINIIEKYRRELELLNKLKLNKILQDIFLDVKSDNDTSVNRIAKITGILSSFSFLSYKQNNQLTKIKLNDLIVENRLLTFLNWCEIMNDKCSECRGPSLDTVKMQNCRYYSHFLQYLEPFKTCVINLDQENEFVLKLYYISDDQKEVQIHSQPYIDFFAPLIEIYKKKDITDLQKKILLEIIHQIVNQLIIFLKSHNESRIDNNHFNRYRELIKLIKIIKKYFKKEIPFNFAFIATVLTDLTQNVKNKLLLIEFWQNKIEGIHIIAIKHDDRSYTSVFDTMEINGDKFLESGSIRVLRRHDLIPKKADLKQIIYKPLIASAENRTIYKKGSKYIVEKDNEELYEIVWQKCTELSQLLGVYLNPFNIERKLESFIRNQQELSLKNNQFLGYTADNMVYKSDENGWDREIHLALNNEKVISDDIQYILKRYCQIVYETEQKHKANIQSAIAAIMARNMSHNLGSHILSYLKQKIKDIPSQWRNNLLEINELEGDINGKNLQLKISKEIIDRLEIKEAEKGEAPFLLGLSRFINYLQERQDFIATVSTNYIPYSISTNFKDYIYDELNWDLRWVRHKDDSGNIDNFEGKEINILLDNIARSEDLYREHIHIFYKTFNGITKLGDFSKVFDELSAWEIDLPAGVVGRQAIFSIIENIIRNAAKHGKSSSEFKSGYIITQDTIKYLREKMNNIDSSDITAIENNLLNVAFKSDADMKDILKIDLGITNQDVLSAIIGATKVPMIFTIEINSATRFEDYAEVKIYDNNKNANKSINRLLKGLTDNYIHSDGSIKEDNKGIKEMRISAAWLRNENITEIEDEQICNGNPPILQITRVNDEGKEVEPPVYNAKEKRFNEVVTINKVETNLCFKFYLKKPRHMVCITNSIKLPEVDKNILEFISPSSYLLKRYHNYKLVLIDETIETNLREDIIKYSPTRILDVKFSDLMQRVKNFNIELKQLYIYYWKEWLTKVSIDKQNLLCKIKANESVKLVNNLIMPIIYYKYSRSIQNDHIKPFFENSKQEQEILFRTHNDTLSEFTDFKRNNETDFAKLKFIEGITGNNSTSRMWLLEEINDAWVYKIIESALTNILIIDERLHEKYSCNEKESHTCMNEIFHKKNIDIINIFFPKENSENQPAQFIIKDLCNRQIGAISPKDNTLEITFDDLQGSFISEQYNSATEKLTYDFVLLHQGIIDKLKDYSEVDSFEIILNSLKSKIHSNFDYIIHSGRSRPSGTENSKFVLYSAIDKAVDDCKVQLCNILYSAYIQKK